MSHALTISGQAASLFWGYREIGALSAWSLSAHGTHATLTGTLERGDAFFWTLAAVMATSLQRQGLEVRVHRQKGQPWRWPVASLQIAGRTVTATVRVAEEGTTDGA